MKTSALCPAALLFAVVIVSAPTASSDELRIRGRLAGPLYDYPPPFATPPQVGGGGPSLEEEVVELINQERWQRGQLPPYKIVALLDNAAELHSGNMASRSFFAHCDPDTRTQPWDRMSAAGYQWAAAAENIAAGSVSARAVVNLWMGSPGHRGNILSTDYNEVGTGFVFDGSDAADVRQDRDSNCIPELFGTGPFRRYWTQKFGRRNNSFPVVIEREAYSTGNRLVDLYLYGSGWAVEMRLRNENGAFSAWQPFRTNTQWTLSSGNGTKTVFAEVRSGVGSVRSSNDRIVLQGTSPLIFQDGFEAGNMSAWSQSLP